MRDYQMRITTNNMCGIIYYHSKLAKSTAKPLLKRYDEQKSRGREGYGYVACDLEGLTVSYYLKTAEEENIKKSLESLKAEDKKSNAILFHHRNPTSTPNLAECAHPILVDNKELEHIYFVIHNGVISNASERRDKHLELGYEYTTEVVTRTSLVTRGKEYTYQDTLQFNDSEALAIDLARVIDGKTNEVEARGSVAFVVLQATRDYKITDLFYGRNFSNPLKLEMSDNHFCLKSEGKGDEISPNKLFRYNYLTGEITERELTYYYSVYSSANRLGLAPYTREDEEDVYGVGSYHRDSHRETMDSYGVPSITTEAYFKQTFIGDFDLAVLLENATLDELRNDLSDEYDQVTELIYWEEGMKDEKAVAKLTARKQEIDDLLQEVEIMLGEDDEEEGIITVEPITTDSPILNRLGFSITDNDDIR